MAPHAPSPAMGGSSGRTTTGRSPDDRVPGGLDLEVHRHGGEIVGRLTLDSAHEAAPSRSHGGIVAGLFDDVFGFVLGILQQPAFTGKLTVRYVHPTPLHRPLACTGWLVERRGRKIWIEGELVDVESGAELARGRTLFIAVEAPARDDPGERPHRPAPPDEDGDAVTPARR